MKDKKVTFSKLPYLGGKLCMTTGEADGYAASCRRMYATNLRTPNVAVRKFTRTVKAGGAEFACYVVVARRQIETVGPL